MLAGLSALIKACKVSGTLSRISFWVKAIRNRLPSKAERLCLKRFCDIEQIDAAKKNRSVIVNFFLIAP